MTDHSLSRTSDGLMLKRYRENSRDPAEREWRALRLLHEYAPGLAPEPIRADLDANPPSITMTEVPGEPLGGRPLSAPQIRAIMAALDRMHTCVPPDVLADVPVGSPGRDALGDMTSQLAAQPRPGQDAVVARAYDDALEWLSGPEAKGLRTDEPGRAVFGQRDHNLTNFLWDGERVRLVDFEYAGRSGRCAELSELVEHISARCTPDHVWEQLFGELNLSRAERRRLLNVRRFHAIMWFHLLLPGQAGERLNPPGTLRLQGERLLRLLAASA